MVQEAEMQSFLVWQQEARAPVLVKRGCVYALLYSAGWGQGKGGIPEQMTQGDNSAALGGVLAAGTVNLNAGTLGRRFQAQPGEEFLLCMGLGAAPPRAA